MRLSSRCSCNQRTASSGSSPLEVGFNAISVRSATMMSSTRTPSRRSAILKFDACSLNATHPRTTADQSAKSETWSPCADPEVMSAALTEVRCPTGITVGSRGMSSPGAGHSPDAERIATGRETKRFCRSMAIAIAIGESFSNSIINAEVPKRPDATHTR